MTTKARPFILIILAICFAPASMMLSGALFVAAILLLPKATKGGAR